MTGADLRRGIGDEHRSLEGEEMFIQKMIKSPDKKVEVD